MKINMSTAWATVQAMINGLIAALPNLVLAFILFVLFLFLAKGLKSFVNRITREYGKAHTAALVLGRLSQWFIVLLGLLLALSVIVPSFKARDLIQLLGISGVAIGFAFRDILQNFLAGILLLLTQPFRIGDQIVVNNYEGTVEDIQTRATMIKTYDGRRIVIPNANLFTQSVTVNTAFPYRRSQFDIQLSAEEDVDRAKQLALEAIHPVDGVLPDPPPDTLVLDFDGSSVTLRVRWWTEPSRRREVLITQDKVIAAIRKKLSENGMVLAPPPLIPPSLLKASNGAPAARP